MRSSSLALLFLLLLVGSCQTGTPGEGSARSNPNLITQEDLDALPAITVYQAVQRLRPAWLRPRSAGVRGATVRGDTAQVGQEQRHTVQVFVDGMPRGDLEVLRQLDVRDFREIRYLSASDATTRYGTGYPGGIIEVITKGAS